MTSPYVYIGYSYRSCVCMEYSSKLYRVDFFASLTSYRLLLCIRMHAIFIAPFMDPDGILMPLQWMSTQLQRCGDNVRLSSRQSMTIFSFFVEDDFT